MSILIYNWLVAHSILVSILISIIIMILHHELPDAKISTFVFGIFQFIGKSMGKKAQDEAKRILDAAEKGAHMDDTGIIKLLIITCLLCCTTFAGSWKFTPSMSVNASEIYFSDRSGAYIDSRTYFGIGGGIAYQHSDTLYHTIHGISVLGMLASNQDIRIALIANLFGGRFFIGPMVNLGYVPEKWYTRFSIIIGPGLQLYNDIKKIF